MLKNYDVVIIGGGISGLYTAINLPSNINVLLCCKSSLTLSNSTLAQGGIAAVIDTSNDSKEFHFQDTMIAGRFENNQEAVKVLVDEGPSCVLDLQSKGARFDKNEDGTLRATLEGGHLKRRVLHHKDSSGEEIIRTLIDSIKKLENIDILENTVCLDIQKNENGFFTELKSKKSEAFFISSSFAVLATGGIGRIYKYTTNSKISTGDGVFLAKNLGAKIKNLNYIQFHPTAFAGENARERFLISEALRGEGAYLLNCNKERFMHNYDKKLELAPRDKVSHSIIMESRKTDSNKFYLDITHKSPEFLKSHFPKIYNRCLENGVDITKDLIPVFPCQHYLMGGIDVNLNGFTGVSNLYAVGECAHTGVHGKNRLASNSLLEGLVFSKRAAKDIERKIKTNSKCTSFNPPEIQKGEIKLPKGIRTQIREMLQNAYFIVPNKELAKKQLPKLEQILLSLQNENFKKTQDYLEAKSLALCASIILKEIIKS